jgi:hypothetical protein
MNILSEFAKAEELASLERSPEGVLPSRSLVKSRNSCQNGWYNHHNRMVFQSVGFQDVRQWSNCDGTGRWEISPDSERMDNGRANGSRCCHENKSATKQSFQIFGIHSKSL